MVPLEALGAVGYKKEENPHSVSLTESERWLMDKGNHWVLARVP